MNNIDEIVKKHLEKALEFLKDGYPYYFITYRLRKKENGVIEVLYVDHSQYTNDTPESKFFESIIWLKQTFMQVAKESQEFMEYIKECGLDFVLVNDAYNNSVYLICEEEEGAFKQYWPTSKILIDLRPKGNYSIDQLLIKEVETAIDFIKTGHTFYTQYFVLDCDSKNGRICVTSNLKYKRLDDIPVHGISDKFNEMKSEFLRIANQSPKFKEFAIERGVDYFLVNGVPRDMVDFICTEIDGESKQHWPKNKE